METLKQEKRAKKNIRRKKRTKSKKENKQQIKKTYKRIESGERDDMFDNSPQVIALRKAILWVIQYLLHF